MSGRWNQEQNMRDYGNCPVPNTHRRLVEAHLLWHQSLANYQEPDSFRANLNATIQALRNVTFTLQSEKHSIPNFDEWYAEWRTVLDADRDAKWLIGARNLVVKQGDLDITSMALVKVITWKDEVLIDSQFPPGMSTSSILDNIPLLELLEGSKVRRFDLQDAALEVERRWSLASSKSNEILETLSRVYALLGDIVLNAHAQLTSLQCVPIDPAHSDFRSAHHLTGILECMAVGREQRTQRIKLSTGQVYEAVTEYSKVTAEDLEKANQRYESDTDYHLESWQNSDPIVVAERILERAKQILKKDMYHARMIFIRDGTGAWRQILLNATDRTQKHVLIRLIASLVERVGADVLIEISEAWMLPADAIPELEHFELESAPSRKEVLQLVVASRDGILRSYITPFERSAFGEIRLDETELLDDSSGWYYLSPVFDVWQRQRTKTRSDGKPGRRVWEPDLLNTCFCGSPMRFVECCEPTMNTIQSSDSIQLMVQTALLNGDTAQAENLSRGSLAQYVIWIKQHTAPTRHVAQELHRDLVRMDILALQSCVYQLATVMTANDHADSIVPTLVRVSKIVGVPEITVRLLVLATESLWRSGDIRGAVAQLESLGDLDQTNDALALILASKLLDLPNSQVCVFLRRAASVAYCASEKISAKLELAKHFLVSGESDSALVELDSAITDTRACEEGRYMQLDALALRWEITRDEEDFRNARIVFEQLDSEDSWRTFATLLINHGDYEEATEVLANSLKRGNVEAYILAVDARLRMGQRDAARKLLLSVSTESIPSELQFPFAYTMGVVALACDDLKLKESAAIMLRKLVNIEIPLIKAAKDLLAALEPKKEI